MSTSFASRHIGPSESEQAKMLAECGYGSLDALLDAVVPASIRQSGEVALPQAATETEATDELRAYAARNRVMTQMIGLGYYDTVTPAVIRRNVLENPAWYTAYTPYQPEISQGRLEALLNFQTMVADLTGLGTSNASLLDEPTALAEAMLLMRRASKSKAHTLLVDSECLPQNIDVLRTRAAAVGVELDVRDLTADLPEEGYFGVIVQYPGAEGQLREPEFYERIAGQAKAARAMCTVAADLLALTMLRSPGDFGADIAVGTTQRFGVPLGYGGPHAGYICVRQGLERNLPGRLVGVSVDDDGAQAYRLALQTREQHIRREKATSNICTAQVLPAVLAAMYAVYHGPEGLATIARRTHGAASELADALRAGGVEIVHDAFFDTVLARVPGRAAQIHTAARERGVNLGLADTDHVRIACDETTTPGDLTAVLAAFDVPSVEFTFGDAAIVPSGLARDEEYLTHDVFRTHHSETAMMRYLRKLSDMDYALDRGMIPLGSCTMKLNAATEMEPISWPEFAGIHPYAPTEDAEGYQALNDQLCGWLADVTGYDAVSVQPNAGSQGEFAGLLAIREYHKANGQPDRDVCLIPSSAHGTNAASAMLAGMRVVVVACTDNGDVDLDALRAKVNEHADTLAAIMVTYPSTHGVYEQGIEEIAKVVHDGGGQVYVDGANLNALLGLAKPGEFGGDVSHLNLHKTFCIPHGGGGPGVGPVAAREHLAPYLPGDPAGAGDEKVGPVAGAMLGSASILPISWAYMRMMGPDGLTDATKAAVLTANYVAARLSPHYPVLYTGRNGLVAHECILDLRELSKDTGVTVDDVAKRLVDYGFHAPTMSFPVNGTLMVEPTESENVAELDRFCAAMIDIRKEIEDIERGRWPVEQSPLRHAPHTAATLVGEWTVPYDRELAVYPRGVDAKGKYWPPVRRVDNASGDRNLVCSCPPMSAYES